MEIVLGLTVLIGLVCFFMVFGMIWSMNKQIDRMLDRLMEKASMDLLNAYSKDVYELRKRFDVLADHLNVKIVNQEARVVVEPKEEK